MKAKSSPQIEDLVGRSFGQLDEMIRASVTRLRAEQLLLGACLAAVQRKGSKEGLTALGCTTFGIYVEQRGLSPSEAFPLCRAAEAYERSPELEEAVAAAKVSVPKASLLKTVLERPELQRPGDDWIGEAKTKTTREFRDSVNRRKAAAQLKEKPVARTLFFSREGIDALVRTRELVSNKRQRAVGESEANEAALKDFVLRHDPGLKAQRAEQRRKRKERRAANGRTTGSSARGAAAPRGNGRSDAAHDRHAHKAGGNGAATAAVSRSASGWGAGRLAVGAPRPNGDSAPRSRYVTADDRHRVLARHGDRCWVEGCEDRGRLSLAHREAFRFRGSNRYWNLARFCLSHHRQFDAALWRLVLRREHGSKSEPLLVDRRGIVVGRLRGMLPSAPT